MTDNTLDYVLSPGEAALDPEQAPESGKQRLRIHIPNVRTTLTMGAKAQAEAVRGGDLGPINYDGFGVHTKDGHVYLVAEDGVAALKATKEVTIHSAESTLDIRSKDNAYLGSDSQTYIHGRTGTLIVGGDSTSPPWHQSLANKFSMNALYPNNDDPDPWDLEDLAEVNEVQQSTIKNFTMVQGIIQGVEKMISAGFGGAGWVAFGFGMMKFASSLRAKEPGPGVGIHGSEGVLITSPKSVATHAHQAVLLSSGFSIDVQGLVSTNIASGASTFLGAGFSTTLMGGWSLKAVSGKKTEIASRFGPITMEAPTIKIGALSPVPPQRPTKEIFIAAQDQSVMGADYTSVIGREGAVLGGGKKVVVQGNESINVGAPTVQVSGDKTVSVLAGEKFDAISGKSQLSAEPSRIVLSVGDGAPKPVTEDEFHKSQHWANHNEFLNAWRAKQREQHAKIKKVKNSWTQVNVTENDIRLNIKGGAEMKGDRSGWKIGGNTLVVKK